jgi:DMSO/TMAO reductase YedYZ molybdopterin-dependent catalytic subunit
VDPDQLLPPGQHLLPELKVKHYGRVPPADRDSWTMIFSVAEPAPQGHPSHERTPDGTMHREVGRLMTAELAELTQSCVRVDLHCASGWSARDLSWDGVPASALIDRFPPPRGTLGILVYGEYGYSANVRLSDLLEPTTLLAVGLNGAPLTLEHGFPVRLVVPHLYAHKSPKWFRGWEYLTLPRRGFWEERGYHVIGDPWTEQRYSYQE